MTVRISALVIVNVVTGIFVLHHMYRAVEELSIIDAISKTFLANGLIVFQALLLFVRTDCIRPLLFIAQIQRISRNEPESGLCNHLFNWILYLAVIASIITWSTISLTITGDLFFNIWRRAFVWDHDYFMFNFSKSILFGWALIAWMVSTVVLALPEEIPQQLPIRFVHLPAAAA